MWPSIIWDATNERKIEANDVTKEEVEEVLFGGRARWRVSRSSGRMIGRAWVSTGRLIAVPVDEITLDIVRPVTAFEVKERS